MAAPGFPEAEAPPAQSRHRPPALPELVRQLVTHAPWSLAACPLGPDL